MIAPHTIYLWMIVTSVCTVFLLAVAYSMLEPSQLKNAFLNCLGSYLFYSIPLLSVFLQKPDGMLVRFTSQCIHGGGIVFVLLLGRFFLMLADPGEVKRLPFKLFVVNYFILLIASFTGLVEGGVQVLDGRLSPIPGPLMPYFNITMVLYGLYFLTFCGRVYKRTEDDLLLCQLRAIFWTGVPSFAMLMITNSIIPGITGDYSSTPSGALWLLLCFAGVGFILAQGKTLLIDNEIRKIVYTPLFERQDNRSTARAYIASIGNMVAGKTERSFKYFSIRDNKDSITNLRLSAESPPSPVEASEIREWVDAIEEIHALSPLNAVSATTLQIGKQEVQGDVQLPVKKKEESP